MAVWRALQVMTVILLTGLVFAGLLIAGSASAASAQGGSGMFPVWAPIASAALLGAGYLVIRLTLTERDRI